MWTNYNHYNPMPIRPNASSSYGAPISKRKWQFYFPEEEVKPSKILVTEDMMANQLDGESWLRLFGDGGDRIGHQASLDTFKGTKNLMDAQMDAQGSTKPGGLQTYYQTIYPDSHFPHSYHGNDQVGWDCIALERILGEIHQNGSVLTNSNSPKTWTYTCDHTGESWLRLFGDGGDRIGHQASLDTFKGTKNLMDAQMDAQGSTKPGLHLSNNYTSHGAQSSPPELPLATPSTSGTSPLSQNFSRNLPKLTMCDELRSLKDSFSILPKVLEPERPTNALILWQPPAGDLGKILQKKMEEQKEKDASENKNEAGPSEVEIDELPFPETPTSSPAEPTMEVELENNNTEMTCAYGGFSRAI